MLTQLTRQFLLLLFGKSAIERLERCGVLIRDEIQVGKFGRAELLDGHRFYGNYLNFYDNLLDE